MYYSNFYFYIIKVYIKYIFLVYNYIIITIYNKKYFKYIDFF